ncbi:TPA: Ig-like domain-containing protein, partial [Aeromonas dhakensis]|nr:Ig-like domain-containing protein [Aeromonas dhakensis]
TFTGTAQLVVSNAVVTALQVTPASERMPVGLSRQFTATAVLSDGSTVDVTQDAAVAWSTSEPAIATITTGNTSGTPLNGLASGVRQGEVTVTASGTAAG